MHAPCFVCLPVKCLCDVLCRVVLVLCHIHRACQASPQLLPYTAIRSSPSRFVDDARAYSVRHTISIRVSKNHLWPFPASAPIASDCVGYLEPQVCQGDRCGLRETLLSIHEEDIEVIHVQWHRHGFLRVCLLSVSGGWIHTHCNALWWFPSQLSNSKDSKLGVSIPGSCHIMLVDKSDCTGTGALSADFLLRLQNTRSSASLASGSRCIKGTTLQTSKWWGTKGTRF